MAYMVWCGKHSYHSQQKFRMTENLIGTEFHFDSLEFQSLEGVVKAIGINPCDLCTYCWTGKEDED